MNKEEFEFLLKQGEGYNLEFKQSFSSDIAKEICAFANATGGKIFIGISDTHQRVGIEITNRLKSQIHDLARNFDPKLEVTLREFDDVLIIDIAEGKDKPYSVNGKFYVRQGTNSQQLKRDEIREFFQKEGKISFDEKQDEKFYMKNDFNTEAFKIFLEKSKISKLLKREKILKNLELLEQGKLKNAGVLLFCKKITSFFLNAQIVCILFLGNDKVNILDKKEFDLDIYSNYQNVLRYIKSKLNTEYIIKTAGPREEKLELPEEAIREALLNAIVHRNYFSNAEIHVYIFKDRIEMVNPGGLVPGIKLSDLGTKSLSRNKLLFGLFQRMNLVEKAGTGIIRIRNAMKEYKLQSPKIETDENWFTITFKRPDLQKESYEQRFYGENVPESTRKVPEKYQEIINELIAKPNISRIELAAKLNKKPATIQSQLRKLVKDGLIRRIGSDKGGYFVAQRESHEQKIYDDKVTGKDGVTAGANAGLNAGAKLTLNQENIFKKIKETAKKSSLKILACININPQITASKLAEMVGSKLVEKVGSKLVENQLKILLLIEENPRITKKELSEILKISTTAIDKNISKLKNLKLIKRIGPDKGGHWEIP